ncbi:hypothetical protein Tco_0117677 [Tanacetum coccineum]
MTQTTIHWELLLMVDGFLLRQFLLRWPNSVAIIYILPHEAYQLLVFGSVVVMSTINVTIIGVAGSVVAAESDCLKVLLSFKLDLVFSIIALGMH